MKFLKQFFSKREKQFQANLPHGFDLEVMKAIKLLGENGNLREDKDAIQFLIDNGIEEQGAIEIVLFLPIAFIRHWLPSVKWHDTFIEMISSGKTVERKYFDSKAYEIIWKVTSDYFGHSPDSDTIIKIGGRSAEFNVINPILFSKPNMKPEDLTLSKTVIIR